MTTALTPNSDHTILTIEAGANPEAVKIDSTGIIQGMGVRTDLLASAVANNSAAVVMNWGPTLYSRYRIEYVGLYSGIYAIQMLMSADGGATYKTSGAYWIARTSTITKKPDATGVGTNTVDGVSDATAFGGPLINSTITLGPDDNVNGACGEIEVFGSDFRRLKNTFRWWKNTAVASTTQEIYLINSGPVNALKFDSYNAGQLISGSIQLYGIR